MMLDIFLFVKRESEIFFCLRNNIESNNNINKRKRERTCVCICDVRSTRIISFAVISFAVIPLKYSLHQFSSHPT